MTELEKIQYAKSFIDKLANGINPLDGTVIKEDDIVNNVRLSRCFFYVSDILRQVVENGGISKKKKRLEKFCLSAEQLMDYDYTNVPIPLSEIAKKLNGLADNKNMKRISYRDLSNWLVSIGMLKEVIDTEGKKAKRPTEQASEMGIFTEMRTGERGTYIITLYNKDAQAFIIDNLSSVIEFKYDKA